LTGVVPDQISPEAEELTGEGMGAEAEASWETGAVKVSAMALLLLSLVELEEGERDRRTTLDSSTSRDFFGGEETSFKLLETLTAVSFTVCPKVSRVLFASSVRLRGPEPWSTEDASSSRLTKKLMVESSPAATEAPVIPKGNSTRGGSISLNVEIIRCALWA